jgi:hypothetical protein
MNSFTFTRRDDGQIDAVVDGYDLFNEALADSISSLPPRGADGKGPSPYWIDVALEGARNAASTGDTRPFTGGNITYLRVDGDDVVAGVDYHDDEEFAERMPIETFVALLTQWRSLVVEAQSEATEALPQTYRRNPHR